MGASGPVPLSCVRGEVEGTSLADFVARNPHPFLLLATREQLDDGTAFQTMAIEHSPTPLGSEGPTTLVPQRSRRASGGEVVHSVVKRTANAFASMITLGRAPNNDLHFPLRSISKFHAYFMRVESTGTWHVVDAGSTNGTFVNGEQVGGEKNRRALAAGDRVRFGPDLETRFFDASAFHAFLTSRERV